MYKIPDEIINFIEKIMKTWGVDLTADKLELTVGIFQGDAL